MPRRQSAGSRARRRQWPTRKRQEPLGLNANAPHARRKISADRTMNSKRLSASVFLIIAGICAAISTTSAWWSASVSVSSTSTTVEFLPGGSYSVSSPGSSVSMSYASTGFGHVGALYEGILVFGIVVAILSLAAGVLGALWALGKLHGPSRGRLVLSLGLVILVGSVLVVTLVPVVQPDLFGQSSSSVCATGVSSPCTSFWGSMTSSGEQVTWGADVGWYLGVATLVFAISAAVAWITSRAEPWESPAAPAPGVTSSVIVAGAALQQESPTVGSGSLVSDQPPGEAWGRVQRTGPQAQAQSQPASSARRFCPACGAPNLLASAFCETCGKPLQRRT